MNTDGRRGHLYLVTGVIIGLSIGLLISWVVAPVRYVDTNPALLRSDFKDQYRVLIAQAFLSNGDLRRASSRLSLLNDPDPVFALTAQAQKSLAAGDASPVQALALLAEALMGQQASIDTATPTLELTAAVDITEIPTSDPLVPLETTAFAPTPSITPTLRPTRTATPTPGVAFQLTSLEIVCDENLKPGLLQVTVLNAAQVPIPGIEIVVIWNGSEDHFFTGLKPEISNGYADFVMKPDEVYELFLANGSQRATDLSPPACSTSNNNSFWGSIALVFQQP